MGLFSANLRAELAKGVTAPGVPDLVVGVDMTLPSGAVSLSDGGAGSAARGGYGNRLVSLAAVERGVDLASAEIPQVEVRLEIADPDSSFGRETERYRNRLRRSPVTIRVMSPNVPDADSFAAFQGLLTTWDQAAPPLKWALTLRGDDKALLGECPEVPIAAFEWPDADPSVLGVPAPHIYGSHSSLGLGATGMLPAYLVDRTGYRYLACLGWLQSIPRVWYDTTLLATSGVYTIERVTVNGIRFTLIDFISSPGTGAVRFDATGYTDNAAGTSGTLITSPEAQILHFLVNFVFNKYRSGDWFSNASAPVDVASFTTLASFCTNFGLLGSRWLGTKAEIREELATWAEGWGFKWYQTVDGKLALGNLDHRAPAEIYPTDFIRGDEEDVDGSLDPNSLDRIVRTIEARYVLQASQSKYVLTARVTDLGVVETITDALDMPGSSAEV